MDRQLLDDLGSRIRQALRDSPMQDVEKNVRALLVAFFDRHDLVPREDFEVQRRLLERAQSQLEVLETRVAELEARARRAAER